MPGIPEFGRPTTIPGAALAVPAPGRPADGPKPAWQRPRKQDTATGTGRSSSGLGVRPERQRGGPLSAGRGRLSARTRGGGGADGEDEIRSPEEIGKRVAFLASDDACNPTGRALAVGGGATLTVGS
jgi:hypothetical protein